MISSLILIQNLGFSLSRWIILVAALFMATARGRIYFSAMYNAFFAAALCAYPTYYIWRQSGDSTLTVDVMATSVYTCLGIFVLSMMKFNNQVFYWLSIWFLFSTVFLLFSAGLGSNIAVRAYSLSGNDNRIIAINLVVFTIIVLLNNNRTYLNFLYFCSMLFCAYTIQARGAFVVCLLIPVVLWVNSRLRRRLQRLSGSIAFYAVFCLIYFIAVSMGDDVSSSARSLHFVNVFSAFVGGNVGFVQPHFSLLSLVQIYHYAFFLIILFVFVRIGPIGGLIGILSCSFVSELFAVPWLLYAFAIEKAASYQMHGKATS